MDLNLFFFTSLLNIDYNFLLITYLFLFLITSFLYFIISDITTKKIFIFFSIFLIAIIEEKIFSLFNEIEFLLLLNFQNGILSVLDLNYLLYVENCLMIFRIITVLILILEIIFIFYEIL
jgi:hypothetical protein